MAEELSRIHSIPTERVPFLRDGNPIEHFYRELDIIDEPHPAIGSDSRVIGFVNVWRALRVHLGEDVDKDLERLRAAIQQAIA